MARHLSVGSVLDKNKITSDVAWVILLDMHITNPNTREVVEVVSVARNDEIVVFNGVTYQPGNFEVQIEQKQNESPSVSLTAQDQSSLFASRLEAVAGGLFSAIYLTVVNTARLDKPAEIQQRFQVLSSAVKNYVLTANLGTENWLNIQFPKHRQWQGRCAWRFKGYGCAYAGEIATCDYSKDGANGCRAHFPTGALPFRGIPGLVVMNI